MSKLQSIIDEINSKTTKGKYLIWREGCYHTGKTKVSIRWQSDENSGHTVIKTAYHGNGLIKTAENILKDKTK